MTPRALAIQAFVVAAAVACPAWANDAMCSAAYVHGQELMQGHALLEARKNLLVCARPPCPPALRPECSEWLVAVEKALPSVVIAARTRDGRDITDARVFVDGQPSEDRLDGRSVELDPGAHTIRVETHRGTAREQSVVLSEGEKDRIVTIQVDDTLPGSEAPVVPASVATGRTDRPSAQTAPPSVLAWVATGTALVAGGTAAYFGISGVTERAQCNPHCSEGQRHDIYAEKFPIADVGFAVTAVAVGVAVYLFWLAPRRTASVADVASVVRF